jgi:hypothetical protein
MIVQGPTPADVTEIAGTSIHPAPPVEMHFYTIHGIQLNPRPMCIFYRNCLRLILQ